MKKIIIISFIFLSMTASGAFTRRAYAVSAEDKMTLAVIFNNPFNPSRGQTTTFRFSAKDADRMLRVRVYTAGGTLVWEFPEQYAVKDTSYYVSWNGKNQDGETVARGIYLVNLQESGNFTRGMVRKVAVVR